MRDSLGLALKKLMATTREPMKTYRRIGTNLEPNGTSLCMEELGDGFSFVFVVCGVFWMLFDPYRRNLML